MNTRTRSAARTRIVVGFDGSETAIRALGRAADEIEPGGTITLVTVEPTAQSPGVLSEDLLGASPDAAGLLEEARLSLGTRDDITVEPILREGDPGTSLLEAARDAGADLIVIGRRGRDFAARALLGSVAERVVSQAPCDVLVVA
jgi:nucleotide-binding universal stress UspA family protein